MSWCQDNVCTLLQKMQSEWVTSPHAPALWDPPRAACFSLFCTPRRHATARPLHCSCWLMWSTAGSRQPVLICVRKVDTFKNVGVTTSCWRPPDSISSSWGYFQLSEHLVQEHPHLDGKLHQIWLLGPKKGGAFSRGDHLSHPPQEWRKFLNCPPYLVTVSSPCSCPCGSAATRELRLKERFSPTSHLAAEPSSGLLMHNVLVFVHYWIKPRQ